MTFPNFCDRLVVLLPRSIFIVSPEINSSNIYKREYVRIAHLLKQWRNSRITILGKTSLNVLNWYSSVVILSSRDEYVKFTCRTPPIERTTVSFVSATQRLRILIDIDQILREYRNKRAYVPGPVRYQPDCSRHVCTVSLIQMELRRSSNRRVLKTFHPTWCSIYHFLGTQLNEREGSTIFRRTMHNY